MTTSSSIRTIAFKNLLISISNISTYIPVSAEYIVLIESIRGESVNLNIEKQ